MKIFDCFIFFNELDLLELRLNILDEFVDYFVIIESAITFQGEDKEFNFELNKERFAKFQHKIIYFKVEKYELDFSNLPYFRRPNNIDEEVLNRIYKFLDDCPHFDKKKEFWWGNDFFQRECIWRALATVNPAEGDLILISDVDEIPNPSTLRDNLGGLNSGTLLCLRQNEFCYYLNYFHNADWLGTCCFHYGAFLNRSLNSIRFSVKRSEDLFPKIINNGGWHFTSLGNLAAIKKKIMSWGHKEFNNKAVLRAVEYNVRHGYDIFRRHGFGRLVNLPMDSNMYPEYLVDNIDKYKNLIGPTIEKESLIQRYFFSYYFKIESKLNVVLNNFKAH
jgi:beta-1,4-mannosyl-glycoprotein beta-1,4-N-acetylglucosaminyltransferase